MGTSITQMLNDAEALCSNGDFEDAISKYRSVIDIDPENATSWYCLGVLYHRIGSNAKSVEAFEKSDRIYPNHPPTLANLAYLLEKKDPGSASEYANAAMVHIDDDEKLQMGGGVPLRIGVWRGF